jgi:hypothetical protein
LTIINRTSGPSPPTADRDRDARRPTPPRSASATPGHPTADRAPRDPPPAQRPHRQPQIKQRLLLSARRPTSTTPNPPDLQAKYFRSNRPDPPTISDEVARATSKSLVRPTSKGAPVRKLRPATALPCRIGETSSYLPSGDRHADRFRTRRSRQRQRSRVAPFAALRSEIEDVDECDELGGTRLTTSATLSEVGGWVVGVPATAAASCVA